jgi:SRSO17 transposase
MEIRARTTLTPCRNCQVAVSVHAVSERGTLPVGSALYLPEEWCSDPERRRTAKIPERVVFQAKPQLASALVERASGWELPVAPILADCAYGDDSTFRTKLPRARA